MRKPFLISRLAGFMKNLSPQIYADERRSSFFHFQKLDVLLVASGRSLKEGQLRFLLSANNVAIGLHAQALTLCTLSIQQVRRHSPRDQHRKIRLRGHETIRALELAAEK